MLCGMHNSHRCQHSCQSQPQSAPITHHYGHLLASCLCLQVQEGHETCATCGRQPNFFDLVKTATNVHTPAFLRAIFMGEHGPILNSNSSQRIQCAGCGSEMPREATRFVCIQATAAGPVRGYKHSYTHKK